MTLSVLTNIRIPDLSHAERYQPIESIDLDADHLAPASTYDAARRPITTSPTPASNVLRAMTAKTAGAVREVLFPIARIVGCAAPATGIAYGLYAIDKYVFVPSSIAECRALITKAAVLEPNFYCKTLDSCLSACLENPLEVPRSALNPPQESLASLLVLAFSIGGGIALTTAAIGGVMFARHLNSIDRGRHIYDENYDDV